jgi:hypothetical protein
MRFKNAFRAVSAAESVGVWAIRSRDRRLFGFTPVSDAPSALGGFYWPIPRDRRLALGYKYFTATRLGRPRPAAAGRQRSTGGDAYLRKSAATRRYLRFLL